MNNDDCQKDCWDECWDEWETNDTSLPITTANQIQFENRKKVIKADMENARCIFDDEEDQTLLELKVIEKAKAKIVKKITLPPKKKEKRILTVQEIEQREIQKKEKNRIKNKKKNNKKKMNEVFGEPDDVNYDKYADFETKYV